jgi:hypothetical protein
MAIVALMTVTGIFASGTLCVRQSPQIVEQDAIGVVDSHTVLRNDRAVESCDVRNAPDSSPPPR